MRQKSLFKLICTALPEGVKEEHLLACISEEFFDPDSPEICAEALRKCELLDWDQYLKDNPDIANAGLDPVEHFTRDGVMERRKLCGHSSSKPKISVIVPNYNNEIYVEKAIRSLQMQTLKNIEIIVIDDASTDNSISIIENIAKSDLRIKLIRFSQNKSQHMARKFGVTCARGEYIMFLDPDDFYTCNACEIAYKYAKDGYDIVCFNSKIINSNDYNPVEFKGIYQTLNGAPNASYCQIDFLKKIFVERLMNFTLWNKIYKADICKNAFELLEDGNYKVGEDMYAFLAICLYAQNYLKVNDELYFYNYGGGYSSSVVLAKADSFTQVGKIWRAINKLCKKESLSIYTDKIRSRLFKGTFLSTLNDLPEELVSSYYISLAKHYGKLFLLIEIIKAYHKNWLIISDKLKYWQRQYIDNTYTYTNKTKTIAIFYHTISMGGAEKNIINMCNVLTANGYKVLLIIEIKSNHDFIVNENVEIIYISGGKYEIDNTIQHVTDFYNILTKYAISLIFYMDFFSRRLLWDILLFKLMGIPVITSMRSDYNWGMMGLWDGYTHAAQLDVNRCADKVICLSTFAELYLRCQGIDSVYIPNAIFLPDIDVYSAEDDNIAVVGRLGEKTKRFSECLYILKLLLEKLPNVNMLFIGGFSDGDAEKRFYELVYNLGISDHVHVIGWTRQVGNYLQRCKALLSTSWREGFPNAIAEAQAFGLPCVMYDLPIMLAEDNPGIIKVAQGDRESAAMEIERLLTDQQHHKKCSLAARKKCIEFSPELYVKNIMKLVTSFDRLSTLRIYSNYEYSTVVNSIAYYATHRL